MSLCIFQMNILKYKKKNGELYDSIIEQLQNLLLKIFSPRYNNINQNKH